MTRETTTPAALLALARSRRMQRALAHAFLHRGQPLPTLRSSLGYMTATTCVTDGAARGHRMSVLGIAGGVAYILEDLGDDAPLVYRLYLDGARQGHLVPLHAGRAPADQLRALLPTLEPIPPAAREAWMLSTRIIQRRALRLASSSAHAALPIRKLTLQLVVEPVSGAGPSGSSTVTAYLHPRAQLADVWALPGAAELALARVTFSGIPCGTGLTKDTVLLLRSGDLASPEPAAKFHV